MEMTERLKQYVHDTAASLRGPARWLFVARTVRLLGVGGQRRVEQ